MQAVVKPNRAPGLKVTTVPTPAKAREIPAAILDLIGNLSEGAVGIGVSVAGLVDHRRGELVWMPHRDGGVALAEPLREATGVEVVVDNDANAAALAEARIGAGRGRRMVLMVTVGTGIGGGLVIEGEVERGRGHLGEIGHTMLDPAGPRCSCGLSGHWEAMGSGRALDRRAEALALADPAGAVARAAGADRPAGRHLADAAAAGDAVARGALEEIGRQFGRGLANMVAVLDPDVIVVGGGVAAVGEDFLGPARTSLWESLAGAEYRKPTPVEPAHLGTAAGLVGAALLAGAPE